jgi:hypothetical protein
MTGAASSECRELVEDVKMVEGIVGEVSMQKKSFDTKEREGEDQMLKKQVINEPMEEQVAGLNTTVW